MRKDCQCVRVRHEHGTYLAYLTDKCHCPDCMAAWRRKSTEQRRVAQARTWGQPDLRPAAFVPATQTVLRLQALAVLGYGLPEISGRIGGHVSDLGMVRLGKYPSVRLSTHQKIARLYDELWDTPSTSSRAELTRSRARKHGWLPPLALDDDDKMQVSPPTACTPDDDPEPIDEIAVQEAIHGRKVRLNRAETSEAVARLTRMGWSAEQIAERLGIASRTVVRHRGRVEESVAA